MRCHEAVCTLSAWSNHWSQWNVPNQCLSPPPPQVLGRWHDGVAWPKSALGQRACHFGLLRAYRNERRSPPTCGHLWIGLPLLNLCDAHGIVAENPLNLTNGFHFLNRPRVPYHIMFTKAVRNIISPCLYLYSHTTYRSETKHKIQLRMCNLFVCLISPRSRLLVRNNDAGAERVFGTPRFKIFSFFSKSFSRGNLGTFSSHAKLIPSLIAANNQKSDGL
jgi:hypothetical protein